MGHSHSVYGICHCADYIAHGANIYLPCPDAFVIHALNIVVCLFPPKIQKLNFYWIWINMMEFL